MEKNTIVGIVLGILVLVSVVQAFQMTSLRSQISGGSAVQTASASQPVASGSPSSGAKTAQVPSSLQNLPDMVGGC